MDYITEDVYKRQMELVGMEGILGAFLAGLVLNRFVPHVSPLMNRLEFVLSLIHIYMHAKIRLLLKKIIYFAYYFALIKG